MGADVEVVTRLTLESVADQMLARISEGFQKVGEESEHAHEKGESFWREGLTMAHEFGVNLMEQADKVKEFAESFVELAGEADQANTAMAGMISLGQGKDWDSAFHEAEEMREHLDGIAESAGVANQGMHDALQTMLEIHGAGAGAMEMASHESENIAKIAGVLGKNAGDIAREFSMMEEGVIRTKGQLFHLLKASGAFGDNVKDIKKNWAAMTSEDRMKILDAGMAKLGGALGKAEPSFNQLKTSIADMYETMKEKLGAPLLTALYPVLEGLKKRFEQAMPEIEKFAAEVAPAFAEVATSIGQFIGDAFTYIQNNADEIKAEVGAIWQDMKDAFAFARDVVGFIVAHKDLFLAIAAAMAVKNIAGGVQSGMAGSGASSGAMYQLGKLASGGLPALTEAASAALVPLAELAPLLLAVAAAGYIVSQYEEHEAWLKNKARDEAAAKKIGATGNVKEAEAARDTKETEVRAAHPEFGYEAVQSALKPFNDAVIEAMATQSERGQALSKDIYDAAVQVTNAYAEAQRTHSASAMAMANTLAGQDLAVVVAAYNEAIKMGDDSTAAYAAGILASTKQLSDVLESSGLEIEGGLKNLGFHALSGAQAISSMGSNIAGGVATAKKWLESALGDVKPNVSLTGGGSMTINIQQDYRNQDPDRVAVVFRRDLVDNAVRRLQSSVASPFGG